MQTYKLIIDGRQQGTVRTRNIEGYLQETFEGVKYEIVGNRVYLQLSWLQAMKRAMELDARKSGDTEK